jgi:hypothetical protein
MILEACLPRVQSESMTALTRAAITCSRSVGGCSRRRGAKDAGGLGGGRFGRQWKSASAWYRHPMGVQR